MDTFDNLSLAFELKLARRRAAEAPCAARDREDSKAIASALEYDHRENLVIHQTCASAYTLLLQRRCASLREVLSAAARHVDESGCMARGREDGSQEDVYGMEDVAADAEDPEASFLQQLLSPFIELATATEGQAATRALQTVGQLLASQQPLVLVNRATWLLQLLEWLESFLLKEDNMAESDAGVRGVAAGAMLDLGICSGSLRCALQTVATLRASASNDRALSINCQQLTTSVERLRESSTISPSSPCGGPTVFLPVAHLEVPHLVAREACSSASQRDMPFSDRLLPLSGTRAPPWDDFGATSKSGKFIAIACDGRYLYVHSPLGLTKYGTGYHATTLGHVYLHKQQYRSTERPWLACIKDKLYLRSPAMAPDCLVVVDAGTLDEIGQVNPSVGADSVSLHSDGSASAMFPEKGAAGVDAGNGDGVDGVRPRGGGGGGGDSTVGRMEQVDEDQMDADTSGGDEEIVFRDDGAPSSDHTTRSDLRRIRDSVMGRLTVLGRLTGASGTTRASAVHDPANTGLNVSAASWASARGAGTDATATSMSRPSWERESRGDNPDLPEGYLPDRHAQARPDGSGNERSPVIADGKFLHIIAKSDKTSVEPSASLRVQELRDEDDESSEGGGGQIGSSWENLQFTLDTFDASDGMRHVRTVTITGPARDYGLQEGEGMLSCSVCGLILLSSTLGYRCQVCPDYDLCSHCWMRGACSQGHKANHQMRAMDVAPRDTQPSSADPLHLPAFPAKCLESECFYSDGQFLMVLIPRELCQGGKVPGFLCRVFDIVQGCHVYDIALDDSQDDRRKGLSKLPSGGSCYDPVNDLVWNVDVDGFKVRRWRHPWTSSLVSIRFPPAQGPPVQDCMRAILACLYNTAEKHARGVMEPCYDMNHTWVPFCIETLPSTIISISALVDSCVKGDKIWCAESVGQTPGSEDNDRNRQVNLELIRTCMRLVVVNIGSYSAVPQGEMQNGNQQPVSPKASRALPSSSMEDGTAFETALATLKDNIMLVAGSQVAELQNDELMTSTLLEATNALTAGFDIFFPTADEQVALLIDLLKKDPAICSMRQKESVLAALAAHLSKPAACNLIFSLFDGRWLGGVNVGGKARMELAQELLLLLLDRARNSSPNHGASADGIEGMATTSAGSSECDLLDLAASFQRHLLSIPLSANRSTVESEGLMLFFARHVLDHALAVFEEIVQNENVDGFVAPVVRVLLLPLATALTDKTWSSNASAQIASDILPRLLPLVKLLDQLNCKLDNVCVEDAVFSTKGTEALFIGGRFVSIPRGKTHKMATKMQTAKVHIPGAAHIVVRISEDVTLTKKEQLRFTWEPSKETSGIREKSELTIKGNQSGKRIWRSFRCPGDSISLHYTRTGPEELKGLRNIRLAVYGCAKSNLLQTPLHWLLDLELTLASLSAKYIWAALRWVPPPSSTTAAKFVATSPLFAGGLDIEWLRQHCPALSSCLPALQDTNEKSVAASATAEVLSPICWSSAAFTALVASYLQSHVQTPDWLSHALFCDTAQHIVTGLIKVSRLNGLADDFGSTWKNENDMPEHMQYVFGSALRIIQGLIMDLRKQMQRSLAPGVAPLSSGDGHAGTRDEYNMEFEQVGATPDTAQLEAEKDSIDAEKLNVSKIAEEKARQMSLRCSLLMALIFDEKDENDRFVAVARQAKHGEGMQSRGGAHNLSMDTSALVHNRIDVASRFLTTDVSAREILGVAAQTLRIAEKREKTLSGLSTLLQTVKMSSVRQVLVSTFVLGPSPVESHRTMVRCDILRDLPMCRQESVQCLQAELAKLFTNLVSMLDAALDKAPASRAAVAMTHLVLHSLHSLRVHRSDAKWLLSAGVIDKLCRLMVDTKSGYLTGASPAQLEDAVEAESFSGVRDEGFAVFSALTSSLARLSNDVAEDGDHVEALLSRAVEVAAHLVRGTDLHPASETRDVFQLKILVWLDDLIARLPRMASSVGMNKIVRHALMHWALRADSPQVQRVSMQLLACILCSASMQAGREALQMASGETFVQGLLASIGPVFCAQGGSNAKPRAQDEDVTMRDPAADSQRRERQWMVMVWPLDGSPDAGTSSEIEEACTHALQQVKRYHIVAGDDTSMADNKAKQVAAEVSSGEKACAYVGTYADCQTVCCHWHSRNSVALVLKTGNARDSSQGMTRWRSGHVKISIAQDQLNLLMKMHCSAALREAVAEELICSLSLAAAQVEKLASNPAMHITNEQEHDIPKGIAVMETICGGSNVLPRVGCRVKRKEMGWAARNTGGTGVIVRCDHLMGTMSVLPQTVLASKSLQAIFPYTVPIIGGHQGLVCVESEMNTPFLLDKTHAARVTPLLISMYSHLQTVCGLQTSAMSVMSHWCRMMQSQTFRVFSHMLQHGLVPVHELANSFILTALVDNAIDNPTLHDIDELESRRLNAIAVLCESPDKAPAALLLAARAPGPGGGGQPSSSGGSSDPSVGGPGSRGQRVVPSVESFLRTSRATQRQDQRRTRELAAAELAEITTQPLRLCQLALERENGNQDRAANWLFEQGEAFLAEHPEFAEVPDDPGGGAAGGAAGPSQDTDTPLFLLHDAFSYYDDMQGLVLGPDSEHAIGAASALGAGMGDLPSVMLDELRALGHVSSDDHGIRVYDERVLGDQPSLVLGRSRIPVAAGASARRDETVRAGHFVALTEMDVLRDPCHPLGKQLVGKTLFVESIDRKPEGLQATCTLYDSATGITKTIQTPVLHLEKVNHVCVPPICNAEDGIKTSVDVNCKLSSVYARNCLRWMLDRWEDAKGCVFDESIFGGRQRLIAIAQAAALGACCDMSDIPTPVADVSKLATDADGGSLSEALLRRLSSELSRQVNLAREREDVHDNALIPARPAKQRREREEGTSENRSEDDSVAADSGRDKRRRFSQESPDELMTTQHAPPSTQEFHKLLIDTHVPNTPLLQFLAEQCLQALKEAVTSQNIVEQASEHPYVRTASNTGANSRRCLHMAGVWSLLVVFDSRCALLPGESLRFFRDAACSELIATAAMDDRRKGFLPLVLPSPVWMQVSATGSNGSDEGELNWGFRVLAFPLGEPSLVRAFWLARLVAPHQHAATVDILEALLDILDKSAMLAAPHCMQAHRLLTSLLPNVRPHSRSSAVLCDHPCFRKLVEEATSRQQWESKLQGTSARQAGQTTRCPHSTYLCSLAELIATCLLHVRRVSATEVGVASGCPEDHLARPEAVKDHGGQGGSAATDTQCSGCGAQVMPTQNFCTQCGEPQGQGLVWFTAHCMPAWLKSLAKAMSIMGAMYCGKQQELEGFIDEACLLFGKDSFVCAGSQEGLVQCMSDGDQLSAAAKEALSELFHCEPDAAAQVARHHHPPQVAAHNKRDFLAQALALLRQDQHKMAELMSSFGFDRFLVRWGPDRDADVVALVNMLTETENGLISPLECDVLDTKLKLTEYHKRKLPRLGSVPEVSLKRRWLLLKMLNQHIDACLVLVDFSRRACAASFSASVCVLQHLIFHQVKAAMHNAVIEWTTCPQVRAGSSGVSPLTREVLLHRPGRRARDNKEKADDYERWRLHISAGPGFGGDIGRLEEFPVAPSDFGSAREMGADATVSARLVIADPTNGSSALRNKHEIQGNIALIERGGGQFVNVVRRAQQAGAIGVVMTDSREGALFLMSTDLGHSGDDVTIPAVLLSLADSMLLHMRQHALTATISADGILMQTYRQLRYTPAARLRQREEMAWRVKFQGEGHQGYQGPYREAISALCSELQADQLRLLVPCANATGLVGENRDKFVPCPSTASREMLDVFFFVGQLMGVAMRTRNLLNLDLPPLVWKSLVGMELDEDDLKATDFSCWNALQFRDHNGQGITPAAFAELLNDCRFTCCLTDGSQVELLPGGRYTAVTYERRQEYAQLVIKARLNESAPQLAQMRAGLCSVIPEQLLYFMTWEELERRVCGSADVDLGEDCVCVPETMCVEVPKPILTSVIMVLVRTASLKRHTQYRQGVDKDSPHIKMFWEVLESFSQADRRLFLRFAWGRERLPLESEYTIDHDMKVSVHQ